MCFKCHIHVNAKNKLHIISCYVHTLEDFLKYHSVTAWSDDLIVIPENIAIIIYSTYLRSTKGFFCTSSKPFPKAACNPIKLGWAAIRVLVDCSSIFYVYYLYLIPPSSSSLKFIGHFATGIQWYSLNICTVFLNGCDTCKALKTLKIRKNECCSFSEKHYSYINLFWPLAPTHSRLQFTRYSSSIATLTGNSWRG